MALKTRRAERSRRGVVRRPPRAYPVFLPKTGDLALMVFQPKKS